MMKSQACDETDEECCDDPIKLFDSNEHVVYFGSQSFGNNSENKGYGWQLETTESDVIYQLGGSSPTRSSDRMPSSSSTSQCDLPQVRVKLVDCGQFPWYYRKYTRQILTKTNPIMESDSDHEIDVGVEDSNSDDCFIVEELIDVSVKLENNEHKIMPIVEPTVEPAVEPTVKQTVEPTVAPTVKRTVELTVETTVEPTNKPTLEPTVEPTIKPTVKSTVKQIPNLESIIKQIDKKIGEKKLKEMRRKREDSEILRALSQKNVTKVDFKRNAGLIGMKITKKHVKTVAPDEAADNKQKKVAEKANGVKNTNTKQKDVTADEKYVYAAAKILSHMGTGLIAIPEPAESNCLTQSRTVSQKADKKRINNEATDAVKLSAQCGLTNTNISENSSPGMKENTRDPLPESKIKLKVDKRSLPKYPEHRYDITNNQKEFNCNTDMGVKSTKSSDKPTPHVKDIKKSNKYKNDQNKKKHDQSDHNCLIGVLIAKPNEEDTKVPDTKVIKSTKQLKHETKNNSQTKVHEDIKKPKQKTENNKREPNSPILPCSIVPKKAKIRQEISPKCNKSDANLNVSKESDNLNKIVTKISSKVYQNRKESKFSKNLMGAKLSDNSAKPFLLKGSSMFVDKPMNHDNIRVQSIKVADNYVQKDTNFKFNNCYNNQSTSIIQNNKPSTEQTLKPGTHQNNTDKHLINKYSVTHHNNNRIAKNDKPDPNRNDPKTVLKPVTESTIIRSDNFSKTNDVKSQIALQNAPPSKVNRGNSLSNNVNAPVRNRYASAIILKPSQQFHFQAGGNPEYSMQNRVPQRHKNLPIPVHTRPRIQDYRSHQPDYHPFVRSDVYQNNSPSSFSNQFSPQQYNGIQQHTHTTPLSKTMESWVPQNLAPPPPPPPPPPPLPPLPPPPPLQNVKQLTYNNYMNTSHCPLAPVSQQYISSQNLVNNPHRNNSSIIGRNNDGYVKKINIVAVSAKEKNNFTEIIVGAEKSQCGSEVVATKTEMLEELDKLSFADEDNNLKQIYHNGDINYARNNKTVQLDTLPKNPIKSGTLPLAVQEAQKELKGYSPPILPIPTFKKVLDRVTDPQIAAETLKKNSNHTEALKFKNEIKSNSFGTCCKRKLSPEFEKPNASRRREDAKKISLDEYKKRLFKSYSKNEPHNKVVCKEKYDSGGKRPNVDYKYGKNKEYGTESDLGYDSDCSTVIL